MSNGLYDEDGIDGPWERRMDKAMREDDARRMPVRFAHRFQEHPKGLDCCAHRRRRAIGEQRYCGGRREEHMGGIR